MKSDFDMIVRRFQDRQDIKIYPIADVHLGAIECMESKWDKFCSMIQSDNNAYLILAGDLINNGVRYSVGNPFEQIYRPREQKRLMIRYLEPLRDKILCMVGGNHERRTDKESDSSPAYDIAAKLDLEDIFRENMAFIKLQFGDIKSSGETNPVYTFAVAHGFGSSIYTTNAATRAERWGMAIDGIDGAIAGHIHKPQTFPVGKYVVDKHNEKVSIKPFEVFICTSWLEGSGYGAQKLMQPTVFSLNHLELRGKKKAIGVVRDAEF